MLSRSHSFAKRYVKAYAHISAYTEKFSLQNDVSLLLPSSYFGGGDAEVLADVTAQISRGGEIETKGYLCECQTAVTEKSRQLYRGIAVDPVSRSAAADRFAGLREVFGRDTEAVGIICDVAMRAVVAALQHVNETVHEVRVLMTQVVLLIVYMCMKIKEIDNHALHGIERQIQVESVVCFRATRAHVFHILSAPRLLPRVEVHHRVVEEHHVSARAVVAERHCHLYKLRRDIYGYRPKIVACICYLCILATLYDDTVACLQGMRRAVEQQRRIALQTERVRQITCVGELQIGG